MSQDKDKKAPNQKDIDEHSGIETTGHEWDGIKELNNPAPRWWLWVFYITCIWSVGYWVVYPAWPTFSGEGERGGTVGSFEWTQYTQLEQQQQEIRERKAQYMERFKGASFDEVTNDTELYAFATAGGKAAFKDNCATCHGTGGAGAPGYPNLNDDGWLWGGTHEDIYKTLKFGIRSTPDDTRYSQMPAFAGVLSDEEVDEVAAYVLSLSKGGGYTERAATIYKEQCTSCHGADGRGVREFGGPNLADAIWFYSDGNQASIAGQIKAPKHGMMPHWGERLDEDTLKQLTIYVHSLGGGE